jgi:hypothetical protein
VISIFCEFSHYDWSMKSSGIYCCTFGVAVHQRFNINDMDSQSQDGLQGLSGTYCQMISSASMLMKSSLETLYFLRMSHVFWVMRTTGLGVIYFPQFITENRSADSWSSLTAHVTTCNSILAHLCMGFSFFLNAEEICQLSAH